MKMFYIACARCSKSFKVCLKVTTPRDGKGARERVTRSQEKVVRGNPVFFVRADDRRAAVEGAMRSKRADVRKDKE